MFIYAMTLFPDKQAKAQQEMDAVVGSNRLPSFSDRSSLPYLEAMFQEVLRYRPLFRVSSTGALRWVFVPDGILSPLSVSLLIADRISDVP
jgi:cytochrome P450